MHLTIYQGSVITLLQSSICRLNHIHALKYTSGGTAASHNCVSPYYFDWREKINFQEVTNKATLPILPAPAPPPPVHQPKYWANPSAGSLLTWWKGNIENPKKEEFPASLQKVFQKSDSIYTIQVTFSHFQRAAWRETLLKSHILIAAWIKCFKILLRSEAWQRLRHLTDPQGFICSLWYSTGKPAKGHVIQNHFWPLAIKAGAIKHYNSFCWWEYLEESYVWRKAVFPVLYCSCYECEK